MIGVTELFLGIYDVDTFLYIRRMRYSIWGRQTGPQANNKQKKSDAKPLLEDGMKTETGAKGNQVTGKCPPLQPQVQGKVSYPRMENAQGLNSEAVMTIWSLMEGQNITDVQNAAQRGPGSAEEILQPIEIRRFSAQDTIAFFFGRFDWRTAKTEALLSGKQTTKNKGCRHPTFFFLSCFDSNLSWWFCLRGDSGVFFRITQMSFLVVLPPALG